MVKATSTSALEHISSIIPKVMRKFKLTEFVPSELDEQIVVFEWAKLNENRYPELKLLHSTLNGVRLPIGLAVKAKRAGMKPGCPDIYLDVAKLGFHGLRIELKRIKGGQLSKEQSRWGEFLSRGGYCWIRCNGAKAAITEIKNYLGIED